MKKFIYLFVALLAFVSCTKEYVGDPALLTRVEILPVGSDLCPNGGELILRGIDRNRNGILDAGEEWVVNNSVICNGLDGEDTTLFIVEEDGNVGGGFFLSYGLDTNSNGILDSQERDSFEVNERFNQSPISFFVSGIEVFFSFETVNSFNCSTELGTLVSWSTSDNQEGELLVCSPE